MSETNHDHRRDELAAYLLGALEPAEAAELERHLGSCAKCQAELVWLGPAAQVLPETVSRVEPSPALRANLMEQVRTEAGSARSSAGPRQSSRWRLRRLAPLGGLAAVALLVAALAGYALSGGDSGGDGTSTVTAGRAPGVTAEMVSQGESGTLHLANLRELPPDEVLQAWVQRGERVVSARTLFVPNLDGTATATIDDIDGVDAVMVTAEPRDGSLQPTSAPIVNVTMPQ